jgi:hypothetical protein
MVTIEEQKKSSSFFHLIFNLCSIVDNTKRFQILVLFLENFKKLNLI